MLLRNAGCLEDVVVQFLLRRPGIHDEESHHEHALVLALELFQQVFRVAAVGSQVRRDDIHVVTGADSLFLLLDLGTVQLRDRVFYFLYCLVLIQGTDMHCHDLARFHIQQVFQKLIGKIGSRNRKIAHSPVQVTHAERPPAGEGEGSRRDEVLYGQPGFRQPLPFKIEAVLITQMEHVMHQL